MQLLSKFKIKQIHILLAEWGKLRGSAVEKCEKAAIVAEFSAGRAESTTCLTDQEADVLIKDLQSRCPKPVADAGDVMRKKIIHFAHEMNWEHADGKADMAHIDNWAKQYGYLHKPLKDYTALELPRLVSQFEKAHKSYLLAIR